MSGSLDQILYGKKPLSRRLYIWWMLRKNYELLFMIVAVLVLIALTEVTFDAAFGTVPEVGHLPLAGELDTLAKRSEWLAKCVSKLPRLLRPHYRAEHRLHSLNRHVFCLAASPMLSNDGVLLDALDGGGGVGFAMWLGVRLVEGRQVMITHDSNRETALNFPSSAAPKQLLLSQGLTIDDLMEKACSKSTIQVLALKGGEPIVHFPNALAALRDCEKAPFVVLSEVLAEDIDRINTMLPNEMEILASGVDYSYSTPLAAPFCVFGIDVWCHRVPWVILQRRNVK